MATILYAWELGGGLGHMMRFLPLAKKLAARGHRVVAALRELRRAEQAFGAADIQYLPAPYLAWKVSEQIEPVRTYADLLQNVGCVRFEDLQILSRAWRTLFAMVRPDLVLCDHSPTALLAASLDEIPCAMIGTGFCCPPVSRLSSDANRTNSVLRPSSLPDLRPWMRDDRSAAMDSEERVLANLNEIRAAHGKAPWERVGQAAVRSGD
jgi:UDP:flavonoid glycosyltransferase YjiC (YdhE family)